tara:strand:- start:2200 stop:2487 length:288 start_codon:yes stop_codon:yes gene_type:complete
MELKLIKLAEKLEKPTVSELIDKLESISSNHTIRGESELHTCLCMLSFSLSKILQITQDEHKTINLVNETLDAYLPEEMGLDNEITFVPDFDLDS